MDVRKIPPEIRKACMILGIKPETFNKEAVMTAWRTQTIKFQPSPSDEESNLYLNQAKDTLLRYIEENTSLF